jgi:hypothetical protein
MWIASFFTHVIFSRKVKPDSFISDYTCLTLRMGRWGGEMLLAIPLRCSWGLFSLTAQMFAWKLSKQKLVLDFFVIDLRPFTWSHLESWKDVFLFACQMSSMWISITRGSRTNVAILVASRLMRWTFSTSLTCLFYPRGKAEQVANICWQSAIRALGPKLPTRPVKEASAVSFCRGLGQSGS